MGGHGSTRSHESRERQHSERRGERRVHSYVQAAQFLNRLGEPVLGFGIPRSTARHARRRWWAGCTGGSARRSLRVPARHPTWGDGDSGGPRRTSWLAFPRDGNRKRPQRAPVEWWYRTARAATRYRTLLNEGTGLSGGHLIAAERRTPEWHQNRHGAAGHGTNGRSGMTRDAG